MSSAAAPAPTFSQRGLAYLRSHAIDPALAHGVGVEESGGALRFPYVSADGSRYLRARALDGGPAKVLQPRGVPLSLWWPRGSPNADAAILVCEGESDALGALTALAELPGQSPLGPIDVCAVPGTGFGAKRLADELLSLAPGVVYLCFDADDAGRKLTTTAQKALRERLAATVIAVELAEGHDLCDTLEASQQPETTLTNLLLDAEITEREARASERVQPSPGTEALESPDGHLTDLGNARRLIIGHGHELRFSHDWDSWLIWNGRIWERDRDGEIHRRAKQTVLQIYSEATRADNSTEDRRAIVKHASRSEAEVRLRALERLARSEPDVATRSEAFDADPWLLNVNNGTLDLRSGYLRPHERSELHTKIAPVEFDPKADSGDWRRFLDEVTGGSQELQSFLQRAVGYSLTGRTDEEVLFFAYGPAATGKSTFLEAVKRTLGSYTQTADFSTFLKQRGGGPRNDIARLAGARLVASLEVDEGERLAESLVKTLTGGDTVAARFLYREAFEFRPQFKLWLAANDRPRVSERDEAMWRRILCIPFTNVVAPERRDRRLKARLADVTRSGSAILAWALEGCLSWQEGGLEVPSEVREATQAYREAMDPLADWLAERCRLERGEVTSSSALWRDFEDWMQQGDGQTLTRRRFSERLNSVEGIEAARLGKSGTRAWRGIALDVTRGH